MAGNLSLISRIGSEIGGEEFVREVTDQLVMKNDWGGLLRAAPQALQYMGQCYVVASHPKAAQIELLQSNANGLEYKHVRANLAHCADLGRDAFREAESQMNRIQLTAGYICEPRGMVDKILRALQNDRLVEKALPMYLKQLEQFSKQCEQGTAAIEDKFNIWLKKAEQIYRACDDTKAETTNKLVKVEDEVFLARSNEQHLKKVSKARAEEKEEAKKDVSVTRENFEKAYKDVHTGVWGILLDTADAALHLAERTGHLALDVVDNVVKKTTYPGPIQSSHRNSKSGIPHRGPSDDFTDCNIVLNDDLAQKLHAFSTALAQDSETDFGVQWTLLSGPTGARGGLAGDILSDLKSSVSKYPLISPSNRVTKIIRNAFDEAVHVAAEIQNLAVEMEKDPQQKLDAETTKRWWDRVTRAVSNYNILLNERQVAAKNVKNNSANNSTDEARGLSRAQRQFGKLQLREQDLAAATNALREAQERDREANEKLHETQMNVKRLNAKSLTLVEVKQILGDCLENLHKLKGRIGELNQFFAGLHNFISHIYKDRNDMFIKEIEMTREMIVSLQGDEANKEFLEEQKKERIRDTLILRGYYAVALEVSSMYVEVSHTYIMPGVSMMDELSLAVSNDDGKTGSVFGEIAQYAEGAQNNIKALADKRKKSLEQALITKRGVAEEVA